MLNRIRDLYTFCIFLLDDLLYFMKNANMKIQINKLDATNFLKFMQGHNDEQSRNK